MLGRGLIEIDIVAGREDTAIALARCLGERFLSAPGLDDDVLRRVGLKDFIPADVIFAALGDELLHAVR